jgi:phage replication-related protein YjqB (UPF0714/DUF867 family)
MSQNEMANKTETEIVNNDAVNADNIENKSKTEGGVRARTSEGCRNCLMCQFCAVQ